MNTREGIKQTISKDNSAERKNRRSNGTYKFSTIKQLLVQPLRPTLSLQHFKSPYFLMLSAIVQGLFLFLLQRLEQACLFNGVD